MITDLKPYAEYKESGLPWLGRVPGHWEVRRLRASITDCVNGIWGADPNGKDDLICVRVADFDRVSLRASLRKKTVRAIPLSARSRRLLKRGDLLLEKSGGGELQPVGAVVAFDHDKPAVCSNFVARMPLAAGYDTFYVNYLHSTLYAYRINVRSIKQTTGIQNLDGKAYLAESVAFPPPDEQAAIVRFLDWANGRLERAIRAKRKVIALLNEQKQAIIHRAVTRGLDPSVPLKDSGVPWLGEIPQHWEVSRIKNEFRCLNTQRVPLNSVERGAMTARTYDYYGASGVIDKVDDYLFDDELLLIAEDGANLVLRNLPLAVIARGKFWVNNHAHILKPKRGSIVYLAHVLDALNYEPWISGAAQPKLTQDRLLSISIAVAPQEEQAVIVQHTSEQTRPIATAISRLEREIILLREYRTRLVADVVTGKLDVRAAAAALPDEAPLDDATASPNPDDDALDADDLTDTDGDDT